MVYYRRKLKKIGAG